MTFSGAGSDEKPVPTFSDPALAAWLDAAWSAGRGGISALDGDALTPEDLLAHAANVERVLRDAGVSLHEPVHVTIANRPADIATLLGVWRAGAVAVPVHQTAAEMTRASIAAHSKARFAVDGASLHTLAANPPPARAMLEGAALVIFTSGTTGLPKGVVVGHAQLAAKLRVLDAMLNLRPGERVLVPLQLTFIFGLWVSLLAIHSNAQLVLVPKFSTEIISAALGDGAHVLAAVPSMLRALNAQNALHSPQLRAVLTGGEPLLLPLTQNLRAQLPHTRIIDLYGLTETGSCDFANVLSDPTIGTIGMPTDGVAFRLMRDDGMPAAHGESGELQIKTPFIMQGYLDQPSLTRDSFNDGFFRTGDLGRRSTDGRVELVGRAKDIIMRGGNKIAPLELDALLMIHPDIAAALCAGVPDARLGEAIHAVIVPKAGHALDPDALRAWAGERLERWKVPDHITFAATLPVGSTGKADRAAIKSLTIPLTDPSKT